MSYRNPSPSSLPSRRDNDQTMSSSPDIIGDDQASSHPTRRAMISTAMVEIDSFKKSWISVMILKSSIGLSQVVALITLLVLASILESPLNPGKKQIDPSDACPHPQLFQAWMAVNICRLTICWMVSCWMCVRYQRSRRISLSDEETNHQRSSGLNQRHTIPHSDTVPSLTFSTGSGSSATLDAISSASHSSPLNDQTTPRSIYTSVLGSNLSLDALASYAMESKPSNSTQSVTIRTEPVAPYASDETIVGAGSPVNGDSLRAARHLHQRRELHDHTPPSPTGFAAWLDRWALTISKTLGLISAVLFVLGNVLVFYPNPSKQDTCLQAAPMLWWGVMTVVAIGWILFGQVFFVVVIVGIGGQAVLALLRRIGVITPPPTPEPARPALPPVLSQAELNKLKLVIYLPQPNESASTDSEIITQAPIDPSRLTHPPVYLPLHKATCAICQETFNKPQEGRSIMLKAEPLRQLPCEHVYHTTCIDQWLLEGHGNCPFCNRSVRETIESEKPIKEKRRKR